MKDAATTSIAAARRARPFRRLSKMKLFQLSQLWMASEAKGAFFGAVKLSGAHRERLRVMLLHDEPGDEARHTAFVGAWDDLGAGGLRESEAR